MLGDRRLGALLERLRLGVVHRRGDTARRKRDDRARGDGAKRFPKVKRHGAPPGGQSVNYPANGASTTPCTPGLNTKSEPADGSAASCAGVICSREVVM